MASKSIRVIGDKIKLINDLSNADAVIKRNTKNYYLNTIFRCKKYK